MPTYAELVDADPTAWLHQARAWDELARQLTARATEIRTAYEPLEATWRGADAVAARTRRDELLAGLARAAESAEGVAVVLGRHAGTVMAAQQQVQAAVRSANPLVTRVGADGTVLPGPWVATVAGAVVGLALYLADARRISGRIEAALADAARSDAETVEALHRLAPGGPEPTPPGGGSGDLPPEGTDPAAVRDWWRGLPPAGREHLLTEEPDRIGELDGVPAADRDRANRVRLDAERVRLRRSRMRLASAGHDDETDDVDELLAGIDALDRALARPGALLLGFGIDDGGRAVVATGDPDRSDHVVTYVPGLGSRLGSVGTDHARSEAIAASARSADPGAATSSITWIGYHAPTGLLSAAGDGLARDGGAALARFQDGLRAGGDAHLTVLGHSYGSLVAGHAAAAGGLAADELVLVGSPGAGTRGDVTDLRMDPSHVWATVADNDPVNHFPGPSAFGTSDPFRPGRQLAHGVDPTDPTFGARVFASDPGTPGPRADDPATEADEGSVTAAHGEYWEPGSRSLESIGRIVVGHPAPTVTGR